MLQKPMIDLFLHITGLISLVGMGFHAKPFASSEFCSKGNAEVSSKHYSYDLPPPVSTAVRKNCQKTMIIWNEYYKPRRRGNIPSDQATDAVGEHCNYRGMARELGKSIWAEMKERKRENPDTVVVVQHTGTLQNDSKRAGPIQGSSLQRKGYSEIKLGSCSLITVCSWAGSPQNTLCPCLATVWATKSSAHHSKEQPALKRWARLLLQ